MPLYLTEDARASASIYLDCYKKLISNFMAPQNTLIGAHGPAKYPGSRAFSNCTRQRLGTVMIRARLLAYCEPCGPKIVDNIKIGQRLTNQI